jgi:antitoxin HicB
MKRKMELDLWPRTRKAAISDETFDEFLAEQGLLEATEVHAIKELIAEQLAAAMREQGLTKVEMATLMKTSRRQLDRLLDPKVPSVTLDTLRGRQARSAARSGSNSSQPRGARKRPALFAGRPEKGD